MKIPTAPMGRMSRLKMKSKLLAGLRLTGRFDRLIDRLTQKPPLPIDYSKVLVASEFQRVFKYVQLHNIPDV
jgi:hypothetical protein